MDVLVLVVVVVVVLRVDRGHFHFDGRLGLAVRQSWNCGHGIRPSGIVRFAHGARSGGGSGVFLCRAESGFLEL